jgi:short-subunit dehydrogenase
LWLMAGKITFKEKYGPWAVVAGGSQGIGEAFARQLGERGLNLLLLGRREKPLNELAKRIASVSGVEVRHFVFDLSETGRIPELEEAARDIEIGLVVYNAAKSYIGNFFSTGLEEHLRIINTNCAGPASLVHCFGKKMMERKRGGIILMSSLSGFQGTPLISTYGATKAFNLVLAEGLWGELKDHGIDVMACCAGPTLTPGYISSKPADKNPPVKELKADTVVKEALNMLGRRPGVIPGRLNRIMSFIMTRLMSRKRAVSVMGKSVYSIYGEEADRSV